MSLLDRRQFLRAGVAAAAVRRSHPPNILVVMSDEHNYRVAGCYGNAAARTPNLDRLASRGVTFETAYTASPLCVPSRLAFTAGKHIHRVSAWNNECRLASDDFPSLPRALNQAGYESFLCGKQHYDATHRYGFTEIGGNMNDIRMTGRGKRRAAGDLKVDVQAGQARFADFHAGDHSHTLDHDRAVTAGVLDFFSRRRSSEKPFFLFAGFLAPHFPLTVPAANLGHFEGRAGMPRIPAGFLDRMPLNYQHLRRGFGLVDVPEETVRRGRELYYGLTEWGDQQIGTVLDALRRSPFADDTVVVYTSDHGENMGEHGLWWKNCVYEQAAHIPLIVSWPERWKGGQRRRGACSSLDVVRTIADIAGARTPEDWDGTSLAPWLDDPHARWKDRAVSQYYAHNVASGYAMIRSGNWKYVYHNAPDREHPAERELYDLDRDPGEFRNLSGDAEHKERMDGLHAALLKELGEHPEETERRCRAELARGYRA